MFASTRSFSNPDSHVSAVFEKPLVTKAEFEQYKAARSAHQAKERTICDALMAAMPGEITFAINQPLGVTGAPVSDAQVLAAMKFAFLELKLVVEPGGATALAALLSGRIDAKGKTAVIVLSGGNVDPELFAEAIR